MGIKAEDDLFALAAKGGTSEEAGSQAGLSVGPVFLEPQSDGRRGINQDGDDPGFETRVKSPSSRTARAAKSGNLKSTDEKKTVSRPRGSAAERSIEEIGEAVEGKLAELFGYVTLVLPVTGVYGTENADKATKALLSIGKRRPVVMKALMKLADGADGMDIGRYILGIVIAIQVDMQRLPADVLIAKLTGVTAIVEKHFMEEPPPPNNNVTGQNVNASPRFQTVS